MVVDATVSRLPRLKSTGEVLDDRRKNGRPRPWKRRKRESQDIAAAFEIVGDKARADRIAQSGSWLEFAECPNGHELF